MKTKNFIWLLVGIILLGGAIGGAFFGGQALGKNHEKTVLAQTTQSRTSQFGGNTTRTVGGGGAVSGNAGAVVGGRIPGGGAIGGIAGFGGSTIGTVQSVQGTTVTMTAQNGSSVTVNLSANTTIEKISRGTPADLAAGSNITVSGPRNPDGSIQAATVLLN
jgi:hypothetical protein